MTKLLWIVHDMAEKKLLLGGLDKMVDITNSTKNKHNLLCGNVGDNVRGDVGGCVGGDNANAADPKLGAPRCEDLVAEP